MSKRAVLATLAWAAATATAMAVVWTGLDAVLPVAAQGPRVAIAAWPEQPAAGTGPGPAGPTGSPSESAAAAPRTRPPNPAAPGTAPSSGQPTVSRTPQTSSTSAPAGVRRRYSTPGGTAVLTLFPDSVVLDAATPATAEYSVRYWTESGLVEVEFAPADAGTVYEVIATWNGTPPQVQTVAVGG